MAGSGGRGVHERNKSPMRKKLTRFLGSPFEMKDGLQYNEEGENRIKILHEKFKAYYIRLRYPFYSEHEIYKIKTTPVPLPAHLNH